MSELRSNPTPEILGSRTEAPTLTNNTEIDLHKSRLGSIDQGLQYALRARAAIDAAMRLEQPRPLSQNEIIQLAVRSISQSGERTVHIRLQEAQSTGQTSEAENFRLWGNELKEDPAAWVGKLDESSDADMIGYEPTGLRR